MSHARVLMYTTAICPYCMMAERLLRSKGVSEVEKIRVDLDPDVRQEMMDKTGRRTVPQIFIGTTHVGGFDDLSALNHSGQLDDLLHPEPSAQASEASMPDISEEETN